MKETVPATGERYVLNLVPLYAIVPLIVVALGNSFTYNVSRLITTGMQHHSLLIAWDKSVPFIPAAIWIYLLAFAQWIISYIVISRQGKDVLYRLVSANLIAKCITLICFIAYPTTVVRPSLTGTDISSMMLGFIWSLDASDNLFPSIHALASWLCFRATFYMKSVSPFYRWGMFVFTLCVFASLLMTSQHTIVDIPGGILALETGLIISKKLRADALFDRAEKVLYSRFVSRHEKK